jgi:hypothetical protein
MATGDSELPYSQRDTFFRVLSGSHQSDPILGTATLESLSDTAFQSFVQFHNSFVHKIRSSIPTSNYPFWHRISELLIPTVAEHAKRVDLQRSTVAPELRKTGNLSTWRTWVCQQAPLSTHLNDLLKTPAPVRISSAERKMHSVICGKSGTGKSTLIEAMLLSSLQKIGDAEIDPRTCRILVELHGDLARDTAQQRIFFEDFDWKVCHKRLPNLVYLEPVSGAHNNFCWNPLELSDLPAADREKAAAQLASAFSAMLPNSNLSLQMRTLLEACFVVVLMIRDATFFDLQKLLSGDQELLQLAVSNPNPAIRQFFQQQFHAGTLTITKNSLLTKLQSLLQQQLFTSITCSKSSFFLEKAIQNGNTIILSLPQGVLGAEVASAIGRLFVARILAFALNRHQKDGYKVPIYLFLDESHLLVSETIKTILTEARKFGVHLLLASQSVGQGMNSELTNAVMGNTAIKMLGRSGAHSMRQLSEEMRVPVSFFDGLAVGEFVMQSGHRPPLKFRCTAQYLDPKTQMSATEWQQVLDWQKSKYGATSPSTESRQADFDLHEDICGQATFTSAEQADLPKIDFFHLDGEL